MFKQKRNILIVMFALVILMGIGFAAYSQQLQINDTSSIDSDWNVYIKDVAPGTEEEGTKVGGATGTGAVENKTTAKLNTDLKYPGDYIIYTITVANEGTVDAEIEKVELKAAKKNTVIKYSIIEEANIQYLNVGDEKTFKVKIEYDPTKTGTAKEEEKSNTLTLTVDYVQKGTGSGTYVPGGKASDKLIALTTNTGDGLYEDEYESGRYIYKGVNPNNYITFNNETWRIMSVESDGTLKIIRKESIGNKAFDSQGLRDSTSNGAGGTYCAQGDNGCNAWATNDNFVNGSKTGTVLKDAELNTYLNTEYYNSLSSESQNLIQNHTWSVGSVTHGNSDLAGQIASENGTTWTGNIGLMTLSEFLRSNTNKEQCGNYSLNNANKDICKATNYYIVSRSRYLWTVSPSVSYTNPVLLVSSFGLMSTTASGSSGVLPAVYLTSDIGLDGEGTSSSPYTIVSE